MRYVLLGQISSEWLLKHDERVDAVMKKFDELGITLEAVYYTQGAWDFIDVLDCPDAESVLAFSVWYAGNGYGRVQSMPSFDSEALAAAAGRA
ncbi:MAG: GYD domain-containing protein [Pseudomonadales bacterium]|nr:GYD domain-containing protein [Pseudomonadales bacterium]